MQRRNFLAAAAAGALAGLHRSPAADERRYRLGWLSGANTFDEPYTRAFVHRLAELGFVEGVNLVIERRHGDNSLERLPASAAELARSRCDVFFAGGNEANLNALARADRDTPIVFVAVDFDPVTTGHVPSLARPGRITGVDANQAELPGKRVELLKELLPATRRMAVFTNEQTVGQLAVTKRAAERLGVAVQVVDFKRPPFDYEAGFEMAKRGTADSLSVLGSGLWIPARKKIPQLSIKARLPSLFHHSQWVEDGGLMSYGFSFPAMWRRAAEMVAMILGGAKAGDIPMEQPTVFELALNARTAKALNVSVPQSIRVRLDRVVE